MRSNRESPLNDGALFTAERVELTIVERVATPDQLREALRRERAVSTMKLGARLLELGLVTRDELEGALQVQNTDSRRHLGEILLDLGLVSKGHLHQVLCEKLGIPVVELAQFTIEPAVIRLLPEDLVRQSRVIPMCLVDGNLVVAMSEPLDPEPIDRVRFVVQTPVTPVMATREDIEQAIRLYYGGEGGARDVLGNAKQPHPDVREAGLRRESAPAELSGFSVVSVVNKIITAAYASGASDIHIDSSAGAQQVAVRFRRDGELTEHARLPGHLRAGVVNRIKTMAGVDISERRRAQEGRIDVIENGPAELQLRVITVPTSDGNEDIAIKLFPVHDLLPLHMLGLRAPVLDTIKQLLATRDGLMLIAGPAGSGKTTAAHAMLTLLNVPGAKIWTAESPVEIARPGLSQVEVNAQVGCDYAAVMSTILRADPDVIMMSEIGGRETAASAVEAALKGCLVVSALHSYSAAETVARLLDMGVDAFSLSDALLGVLGQRVVRRLCARCRRASRPFKPAEIEALLQEYCEGTRLHAPEVGAEWIQRFGDALLLYEANGCELCVGTGYRGRIGLHELLLGGSGLRPLIRKRQPVRELAAAAIRDGMRTLKQDGIEKALAGDCDLREVRAATV
jgi:type II secretory ATPase GspE/PulE/Tfp pilus assembly ATPase PilB-like protein